MTMHHGRCYWSRALCQVSGRACSCKKDPCCVAYRPPFLQALKQLSRDKTIILKKADKGTTYVMMSKENKINEVLALLNEKNNYQPLTQPMVESTTRKGTQLIKSLLQEGQIDDMTAKWLSLMTNTPRIPIFYTLTKIHKPTPVGRPIIAGCDGPTEDVCGRHQSIQRTVKHRKGQ